MAMSCTTATFLARRLGKRTAIVPFVFEIRQTPLCPRMEVGPDLLEQYFGPFKVLA